MKLGKVLILIPGKNARGGITNYYASIRKYLPKEIIYLERGARNWPQRSNMFSELLRMFSDYANFIYSLLFRKISIVQTTTAFYKGAIIRDGIFLIIAHLLGKKTIVFFRGWNDKYAHNLSGLSLRFFKVVYFNTNALVDLSTQNVDFLRKLGYKKEIYLETTVVDEDLLENIDVSPLVSKRIKHKKKTILFLSRIEKAKGIYKLLETFQQIKSLNDDYELIFAGDGTELKSLKEKIKLEKIKDVKTLGFVQGKQKSKLFEQASIFVFLSDYEGMPNAVLEAMAFGLPVLTTNVGGIASVFRDNHNGYLLESYIKENLVKKIEGLIKNKELYKKISENNYKEAREKLMSNIVAKRMVRIFDKVTQDK
jgi:glycosyltransferase involved in cell wall biosynthesis